VKRQLQLRLAGMWRNLGGYAAKPICGVGLVCSLMMKPQMPGEDK
jgi:hypothetical protein